MKGFKGIKQLFVLAALALGVLAWVACGGSQADPPPLPPSPIAVANGLPYLTPAVAPVSTPTPTSSPGPTPTPTPLPRVNLKLFVPPQWAAPIIAAPSPGQLAVLQTSFDGPIYVSWAVADVGPERVEREFFVDLYFDDMLAERWRVSPTPGKVQYFAMDWEHLHRRFRITAGDHMLRLVIDPTNVIPEVTEEDNVYAIQIRWTRDLVPPLANAPARKGPNLAPFTPAGWDSPIKAYSKVNGEERPGLSVDAPAIVRVAYRNRGLTSVRRDFFVHLYLDDILVAQFHEPELLAGDQVLTAEWADLHQVARLSQGTHILRVVLDATSLIDETDKTDNTFSRAFLWGAGQPSQPKAPESPSPEPVVVPFTVPGWDSPLVITRERGRLVSGAVSSDQPAYLHWAVKNTGTADLSGSFRVNLLLDGQRIATWERPGLKQGQTDLVLDWPFAPYLEGLRQGPHLIALNVETGISANSRQAGPAYQREFLLDDDSPSEASRGYTVTEVRRRLATLDSLLVAPGDALSNGRPELLQNLLEIADAVYFSIYQRTFAQENLSIAILSDDEFDTWVLAECEENLSSIAPESQEAYRKDCARLKGFAGFETSWRGQARIVIRGQRSPPAILIALAHELGHFRQRLLNPALEGRSGSLNVRALREAQAYAHEVLFLRTLESLTGRSLLLYPDLNGFQRYIEVSTAESVKNRENSEHDRGRLLLWLAVLTDPELRSLRNRLFINRNLSPEDTRALFQYLVSRRARDAHDYVSRIMTSLPLQQGAIESLAKSRLIANLPPEDEGPPYFREPGLLLP